MFVSFYIFQCKISMDCITLHNIISLNVNGLLLCRFICLFSVEKGNQFLYLSV